jgi:hypothetical protein
MGRTVAELQAAMSSREFTEWQAYFALEPFGEERADIRAALVASVIANVNRNPKKRSSPFAVKDFMLRFGEAAGSREQSVEQQLSLVEMLNAAFGGVDKRKH